MNVLVVDDDVVSRMVLMHLVSSCGSYQILEAADGQDAWDQLQAGLRPAVLFCDLRMPHVSGLELLARVRADDRFGALPFILVTSSTDSATLEQAASLGVSGLIVKPFQAGQVRVQLAAFSDPPEDWIHRAETPAATLARLRIDARRLLAYLGGFQAQLTAASGEIDAMAARGEPEAVRERIGRLHKGCVTLGLGGAADAFDALGPRGHEGDRVHLVLLDALRSVLAQTALARALLPGH